MKRRSSLQAARSGVSHRLAGLEENRIERFAAAAASILVLFGIGTVGFHITMHEPWHAAFYRTVITATLTGLDSAPSTTSAEILTILIALGGVVIFGYVATQAAEMIAREVTGDARRDKRRHTMIENLENHFVICGYGRVGRRAAEEFAASGVPFVVLDLSKPAIEIARERGVLYLEGSGAEDGDLRKAGIDRALGLLASADSDAENLYITLSARAEHPELMIVARASTREAERKLMLAGANRVVQPYSSAGTEMAKLALKPQVAAFLELVCSHAGPDLRFEEIEVRADCVKVGKTIRELRIRSTTGAVIIALRKPDGHFDVTPSPDIAIEAGDVLIAIGTEPELKALEDIFVTGMT